MDRRRFDHLYEELSLALGRLAPRYALWLYVGQVGLEPDRLSRADVVNFCRQHLTRFLSDQGLSLLPRRRRRFERTVARFDPRYPTPYEHMARMSSPTR